MGAVEFTPTLSNESDLDIVITYSTAPSGDFPVESDDYTPAINAEIVIPAGRDTPLSPIRISTLADSEIEQDETFTLTYSATAGPNIVEVLIPDGTTIGTINNDDLPELTIADAEGTEGTANTDGVIEFIPTLSSVF